MLRLHPSHSCRDWTINFTVAKVDVTAMGDHNLVYVAGLPDASGDFTGWYDDATSQTYISAVDGVSRNFYLYPNSNNTLNYFFGQIFPDFSVTGGVAAGVGVKATWNAGSPGAALRRRRAEHLVKHGGLCPGTCRVSLAAGWLCIRARGSWATSQSPYYGFVLGVWCPISVSCAFIGGLVTVARQHNCHQRGCWRIGRHVVNGSPWCNRHHHGRPHGPAAAARHAAAVRGDRAEARQAVGGHLRPG